MSSPHHHHGSDDVIIIGGSGSDVSSSLPHHETILSHAASSPDILNLNKPTSSLHTASIELQQQQNQLQSQLSVSLKETTNSEVKPSFISTPLI